MQHNGENETVNPVYEEHWNETWIRFNRALRSRDDFNAFQWVYVLLKAALGLVYFKTGLHRLGIHNFWRSCVPAFGVGLIASVLLSYFFNLRSLKLSIPCTRELSLFHCSHPIRSRGSSILLGNSLLSTPFPCHLSSFLSTGCNLAKVQHRENERSPICSGK